MHTRIKICGITRPEDAAAAARAGADMIGMVFVESSPRRVNVDDARRIAAAVPAGVTVAGLFLDPERELVETVLRDVPLELLQFHGSEPADFCRGFGRRYIKTIGVGDDPDKAARLAGEYRDAAAVLFDSHAHGLPGGTGQKSDWRSLPQAGATPVMLAGGLTPGNVGEAIRIARPHGVDVSSGVEARPGVKDHARLREFINEVRRVDRTTG